MPKRTESFVDVGLHDSPEAPIEVVISGYGLDDANGNSTAGFVSVGFKQPHIHGAVFLDADHAPRLMREAASACLNACGAAVFESVLRELRELTKEERNGK